MHTTSELGIVQDLQHFADQPGIFEHPTSPDKLIRLTGSGDGQERAVAGRAQQLFDELPLRYDMETVNPLFAVIGKRTVGILVDKADGISFSAQAGFEDNLTRAMLSNRHQIAAEKLLKKQYSYIRDKVSQKGQFLYDIYGLGQHVFTNDGRAVLVDVDPIYSNDSTGYVRLDNELLAASHLLKSVGIYFAEHTPPPAWRRRATNLINHIFVSNGYGGHVSEQHKLVEVLLGYVQPEAGVDIYDAVDALVSELYVR